MLSTILRPYARRVRVGRIRPRVARVDVCDHGPLRVAGGATARCHCEAAAEWTRRADAARLGDAYRPPVAARRRIER